MHVLKKGFAAVLFVAVLVVGSSGLAASFSPATLNPLSAEGLPSYPYPTYNVPGYVTPLAFDSTRTLQLRETWWDSTSAPLFTNQNMAADFGQTKRVDNLMYLGMADVTGLPSGFPVLGGEILNTNSQTVFLKLINPWTVFAADKSLTLSAGTILVCYDEFATWDKDYNDFIFAISDTAPAGTTPTPIPGALWLLGSGLMGLIGIKRARKGQ